MPPEFLYKYMPVLARDADDDARAHRQARYNQCFTENRLYFSHPRDFNDPMDTKPHFVFEKGSPEQLKKLRQKSIFQIALRNDPKLQGLPELLLKVAEYQEDVPNVGDDEFDGFIQNAVTEYVRDVGILCLSESGSCPVMFYHYADAHRGICMKFRADADYFAMAEPVLYGKEYPEIDYFSDDDGTEFERIFLKKYVNWQYEKEWRVVDFQTEHTDDSSRRLAYNPALLEAVIFGYRMPEEERVRVANLLNGAGRRVSLLEAKLKSKSFELEVVEWSPQ